MYVPFHHLYLIFLQNCPLRSLHNTQILVDSCSPEIVSDLRNTLQYEPQVQGYSEKFLSVDGLLPAFGMNPLL